MGGAWDIDSSGGGVCQGTDQTSRRLARKLLRVVWCILGGFQVSAWVEPGAPGPPTHFTETRAWEEVQLDGFLREWAGFGFHVAQLRVAVLQSIITRKLFHLYAEMQRNTDPERSAHPPERAHACRRNKHFCRQEQGCVVCNWREGVSPTAGFPPCSPRSLYTQKNVWKAWQANAASHSRDNAAAPVTG